MPPRSPQSWMVDNCGISKKMTKHAISFEQAIELGEYDPEFLAQYSQWQTMSRHVQYQFIRQALENRHKQLRRQWADLCNQLDFRLKPHLKEAQKKVELEMKKLNDEEERLLTEYAGA